jgi:hypothetical protein
VAENKAFIGENKTDASYNIGEVKYCVKAG